MASPVVTRPPTHANVDDERAQRRKSMEEIAQWVRWVVAACLVLGVVGLIVLTAIWFNDSRNEAFSRTQWDEVAAALKDKTKPEDQIAALEAVSSKISGSPAHAFVLMRLGDLYFRNGIDPAKNKDEQNKALNNAKSIFDTIVTKEPYASNKAFAPFALEGEALVLEQQQDYSAAIKLLDDNLRNWESHPLYNRMSAQLGRLYYLRSLKETGAEKEKDIERAREKLTDVLRPFTSPSPETKVEELPEYNSVWREQAQYIHSLLAKPGKALPDGKAPPIKAPPAAVPHTPGAMTPLMHPPTPVPPTPRKAAEQKKAEPAKADALKTETKTETKKDDAKAPAPEKK